MTIAPEFTSAPIIKFLVNLGLSDKINLALFGFSNSDVTLPEDKNSRRKACPTSSFIEEKLNAWAKSRQTGSRDVSIAELSEAVGISCRHLRNYFKDEYGQNFSQWKMDLRISQAQDMMQQYPDKTVTSIAKQLGFDDKTNFHRQFRRTTGCTPKQWKRLNCK